MCRLPDEQGSRRLKMNKRIWFCLVIGWLSGALVMALLWHTSYMPFAPVISFAATMIALQVK